MPFTIEVEQEDDGRWLTEIPALAGVLAYGQTREEAIARAQILALRVLADRLEHGESIPAMHDVFAVVAWASGLQPIGVIAADLFIDVLVEGVSQLLISG
jgi:predicted RNase H-like HicB family nuclease